METEILNNQNDIYEQVYQYFEDDCLDKAKELLIKAIERFPDDHLLYAQLAITFYEFGNDNQAIEYAEKALQIEPNCQLALNYYAIALQAVGRDNEAIYGSSGPLFNHFGT